MEVSLLQEAVDGSSLLIQLLTGAFSLFKVITKGYILSGIL